MRLPLRSPARQTRMQADKIFAELKRAVPKTDKGVAHHNSWIFKAAWRLVDERVFARREPGRDQVRIIRLGRAIRAALKEDRKRWAETAGEDVERLLTGAAPPLRRMEEDEGLLQSGGGPRPAACTRHTQADNGRSHRTLPHRTPSGDNIPTSVMPDNINGSVPTEEEVDRAVRRLWGHRSRGPSLMRTKHLQERMRQHQ